MIYTRAASLTGWQRITDGWAAGTSPTTDIRKALVIDDGEYLLYNNGNLGSGDVDHTTTTYGKARVVTTADTDYLPAGSALGKRAGQPQTLLEGRQPGGLGRHWRPVPVELCRVLGDLRGSRLDNPSEPAVEWFDGDITERIVLWGPPDLDEQVSGTVTGGLCANPHALVPCTPPTYHSAFSPGTGVQRLRVVSHSASHSFNVALADHVLPVPFLHQSDAHPREGQHYAGNSRVAVWLTLQVSG